MHYFRTAVTYGLYPFLLVLTGALCWVSLSSDISLPFAFVWIAGGRFVLLQGLELIVPLRKDWSITRKSLWRDIKFAVAGLATMRLWALLVAFITIDLAAGNPGILKGAPLWIDIIGTALVFEFFQYWFHRFSHEGKGWLGEKLWQIHVAHHLPDRVYLVMHAVAHPINTVVVIAMVPLTTCITGASQEAVLVWFAFRGLHGLLSHYNVDIRAGWLNYLFVGTELHRYHHSAALDESKNYGSLLIFWDQLFGTFVYRPGVNPAALGVAAPAHYPESYEVWQVLMLPFRAGPAPEEAEATSSREAA